MITSTESEFKSYKSPAVPYFNIFNGFNLHPTLFQYFQGNNIQPYLISLFEMV